MKGLIILANGFEDIEAIATTDVLKRSGLKIDSMSVTNTKEIISQTGIKLFTDYLYSEIALNSYDFLIIPGGGAVSKVLDKLSIIDEIITRFVNDFKIVASICAAPSLVGKLGFLNDKKYTCFPGYDKYVKGGKYLHKKGVVTDGKFITAKSMAYSIDFALEIIKELQGKEQMKKVYSNIYANSK